MTTTPVARAPGKRSRMPSAMTSRPRVSTASIRASHVAASPIFAAVPQSTRAATRSGSLAARLCAIMPPTERPTTAKRAIPK